MIKLIWCLCNLAFHVLLLLLRSINCLIDNIQFLLPKSNVSTSQFFQRTLTVTTTRRIRQVSSTGGSWAQLRPDTFVKNGVLKLRIVMVMDHYQKGAFSIQNQKLQFLEVTSVDIENEMPLQRWVFSNAANINYDTLLPILVFFFKLSLR